MAEICSLWLLLVCVIYFCFDDEMVHFPVCTLLNFLIKTVHEHIVRLRKLPLSKLLHFNDPSDIFSYVLDVSVFFTL